MPEFLGSLIATTRNSRYDPHVGNCSTVQAQNETIVCRYDPVRYNSSRQKGSDFLLSQMKIALHYLIYTMDSFLRFRDQFYSFVNYFYLLNSHTYDSNCKNNSFRKNNRLIFSFLLCSLRLKHIYTHLILAPGNWEINK